MSRIFGTGITMAEYVNQWESYKELSIENDRDPVLDDPIIYLSLIHI